MCANLNRQDTRIHNTQVSRIVHLQSSINDPTQITAHHRSCPNRVGYRNKSGLDPRRPRRVAASVPIVIRHLARAGERLARRDGAERGAVEHVADEARGGGLDGEVDVNVEPVNNDLGASEDGIGCDGDVAAAEGEELPHDEAKGARQLS